MEPETRRLTTRYSVISAVTSFVTQPIPIADEFFVIPIHYRFAGLLARKVGRKVHGARRRRIHMIIWGGTGVRVVTRFTLGLIPLVGAFANAVTAVVVTELLANHLDKTLKGPELAPAR